MTQLHQFDKLGIRILQNCRNELYSLFPYLDGAFASLPPCPSECTATIGTDGQSLFFDAAYLTCLYEAHPASLRRGYMHLLLHCLFLHPFPTTRELPAHWDLACDMAVELILYREENSRLSLPENSVRTECLQLLSGNSYSAEQICSILSDDLFPYPIPAMEAAFRFDDHLLWRQSTREGGKHWQNLLFYTNQNRKQHSRRIGTKSGDGQEVLTEIQNGPYDYRKFLQRFAVSKEELSLDPDSFDYIYYSLGMDRYGNLPLIEPLEYREGSKLEELVIAIDTSGSCSRETVQCFLSDTYRILSQRENFFQRMNVYLIQCDCIVQSVAVIHSAEEWKNYSRSITIQGRGGTDFTPVFNYVEKLRSEGKLKNLKALLYFTDGDGFFPREKTEYETAFVFLEKTDKMDVVPSWAHKLLVR